MKIQEKMEGMEINFTEAGGLYTATAAVRGGFALHLRMDGEGTVSGTCVLPGGEEAGFPGLPVSPFGAMEGSFGLPGYPAEVRLVSTCAVSSCVLAPDGEWPEEEEETGEDAEEEAAPAGEEGGAP